MYLQLNALHDQVTDERLNENSVGLIGNIGDGTDEVKNAVSVVAVASPFVTSKKYLFIGSRDQVTTHAL